MAGGRPSKFKTLNELNEKINGYFAACKEEDRPLTITGLAVALETTRETIMDVENGNGPYTKEYSDAIKKAKQKILAEQEERLVAGKQNPAGLIFSMKNNYGWKDKQEIDQSISGNIEVTFADPDLEKWSK